MPSLVFNSGACCHVSRAGTAMSHHSQGDSESDKTPCGDNEAVLTPIGSDDCQIFQEGVAAMVWSTFR